MTKPAFTTPIDEADGVLNGPWRTPRQMLAEQTYDGHASIHDDETAQKLGFRGGTIEGPTHFSQIAPLGEAAWGEAWWRTGCISAHYRTAVYEGEKVQGFLQKPTPGANIAAAWAVKEDGSEVFRGTASVAGGGPTELEQRLKTLPPLEQPVILRDVKIGLRSPRQPARMGFEQHLGDYYPFTLAAKLKVITEPSDAYSPATVKNLGWERAVIPMEMVSVLLGSVGAFVNFPARGPNVGLFADQEIRLFDGPLLVDEPYEIEREVIALSGSRRTESAWVRTDIFLAGGSKPVAHMILNQAILVESYASYA
ncbi:MAG: hypothetical protein AB7O04_14760, partial [Hyphomonadaceae bacterium]